MWVAFFPFRSEWRKKCQSLSKNLFTVNKVFTRKKLAKCLTGLGKIANILVLGGRKNRDNYCGAEPSLPGSTCLNEKVMLGRPAGGGGASATETRKFPAALIDL